MPRILKIFKRSCIHEIQILIHGQLRIILSLIFLLAIFSFSIYTYEKQYECQASENYWKTSVSSNTVTMNYLEPDDYDDYGLSVGAYVGIGLASTIALIILVLLSVYGRRICSCRERYSSPSM